MIKHSNARPVVIINDGSVLGYHSFARGSSPASVPNRPMTDDQIQARCLVLAQTVGQEASDAFLDGALNRRR